MTNIPVTLDHTEARYLFRLLHRLDDQSEVSSLYLQLQKYFFQTMTVAELMALLEEEF